MHAQPSPHDRDAPIAFLNLPLWSAMDAIDDLEDYEVDEDDAAFEASIAAEIQLKFAARPSPPAPDFDNGADTPIAQCASPTSYNNTYFDGPTISTPGNGPALRPPPSAEIRPQIHRNSAQRSQAGPSTFAPDVPSPVNSPLRRSSTYEGSAKRDDPATPVPLGTKLVKTKPFRSMSTLFRNFEKGLEKEIAKKKRVEKAPAILDGCRICLPVEVNLSLHDSRWKIITQLGGKVVIQPDTAITHVICEGTSAMGLASKLGLESLSELPEGTVCVKWEWVRQCRQQSRRLDPDFWRSFKGSFSKARTSSKLREDITNVRKREHTASESETESSNRQQRPRTRSTPDAGRHSSPARLGPTDNRTVHDAPKGPGWVDFKNRDGLDEVISGVQAGDEPDEEGNPNGLGDRFKCGQNHDGSDEAGPNAWLASKMAELHDMYSGSKHKNDFQIKGYMNAASAIARTTWPITSGAEATKIKGIGENLRERIDEFLEGRQGRLFYDMDEQMQVTQAFSKVYGIGKTQAAELYQKGARTLADLADPMYHLTENQKIGLEHYDDLNTRIPRPECKAIHDLVKQEALAIDPDVWIEIMGSYRRGQDTSGDVDFLITRDPTDGRTHAHVLHQLIKALMNSGFITHELSRPTKATDWFELEAKWMGICRLDNGLYRRIDILCIPFESWGAALIYFTGNDIFNRSLRLYARKLGYSLNQRGLSKDVIRAKDGTKDTNGVIVASRTEQEIFDVLGLRWRPPHQRRP